MTNKTMDGYTYRDDIYTQGAANKILRETTIETYCVSVAIRIEPDIGRSGNKLFKPIYLDFMSGRSRKLTGISSAGNKAKGTKRYVRMYIYNGAFCTAYPLKLPGKKKPDIYMHRGNRSVFN
ncbi:hypothetical protein GTR04_4585 [Trichophyton interdigitale]|uniref:Uncharacterized protein n=2 Tax=Trichophyton interdigitale TaxID=101480 RepID=A0A9P4YGE9_9EURO|nr:hypothetical protein GY631_4620 [Trichophyton interdigitale]KAF3892206.1 hypothetical protein GY632_4754 [Trichophyton interdigitale]KAG8208021.1 hypothetical protein GTR04_4585 [Trichophyton interdigitale]KDB23856.1 hypothetical protein H109_04288 [Trichophyton interdigitale MR816]